MPHLIMPLLVVVASLLTTATAYADLGDQLFKLLADDGGQRDAFGVSVAISGTTAIVGALDHLNNNNCFCGAVYLFDTTTGQQLFKILPTDGAASDYFGSSVAIGGSSGNEVAIVGAHLDDDTCGGNPGCNSGSAYLFDISDPVNPTQLAKLLVDDGQTADHFGYAVAITGTTAIVGARKDDDNGVDSGSAYLFDISDPANPTQIAKLLADDGAEDDRFGASVAMTGTTAIIGAHGDDDNGLRSGAAYLFDISDPANPTQIAKLVPSDNAVLDRFGVSVAISGAPGSEVVIVGASGDDDNATDSGAAYLFDASFCPWDLDDNGSVGASDLLALLVSWGPCKGCPADFDGNGSVGAIDLLALLVNWGPCP